MRQLGLAIFLGLLAVLALPPVNLFPLIIPAYGGLFWLLNKAQNARQGFRLGWGFGLGYFTGGLYWFAYPLLIEPEKFAWMIPFAVIGLPAVLAVYYGLSCAVFVRLVPRRDGVGAALIFAVFWTIAELLRGMLFTGFPWNLAALSWSASLPMLQPLSLMGVYLYSGYTVLLAVLPAVYRKQTQALALCLAMLLLPFGYGAWRLDNNPTHFTDTTIKLVQPSIPQQMKMQREQRIARIETHVALSRPPEGEGQADLLIWSESSYPFFFEEHSPPIAYIAREVIKPGGYLVMGVDFYDRATQEIFNSIALVDESGALAGRYDKEHLVPFGEYAPLRWLLPIDKIVPGMKDFSAGTAGQVVNLPGVPSFRPLSCYEAIFPEMAASSPRPKWLLNTTNDAWFGVSSGPYQHFEQARMRAIEQGLPLVRVANNGISAVVDPLGRTTASLPLNKIGSITTRLPQSHAFTFYAQWSSFSEN